MEAQLFVEVNLCRDLFVFGEGEISAEANHAQPRCGALATAKAGARFEFAFERNGERNDQEIGGGVERDRNDTKDGELKKDVATFGSDELRDEGEEKESGFGIEGFGENALAESAACGRLGIGGQLGIARANHFDAKKNEISGACVFYGVESDG